MKTIKNLTKKPLSIQLPGGKKLFLSPGKTGQIATKAAAHPPLVELIEAGQVEIVGEGGGPVTRGTDTGSSVSSSQDHIPDSKSTFRSGDR